MSPDLSNRSDIALVDKTKQGDSNAYGELYDRYFDKVFRFIAFRVSTREEAEDLTEISFLKTLEAILHGRSKIVNFQGWLFRTAHNLIVDHYRMQKELVSLDDIYDLEDGSPRPEGSLLEQLDHLQLARAVAALDPDMQQLIACRFISGLTHAETAEIMGINEGYLRVLQYRALKQLRKLLEKELHGHE
jgi:RNA polymerase sigma-70 factor, ECF subfamily